MGLIVHRRLGGGATTVCEVAESALLLEKMLNIMTPFPGAIPPAWLLQRVSQLKVGYGTRKNNSERSRTRGIRVSGSVA